VVSRTVNTLTFSVTVKHSPCEDRACMCVSEDSLEGAMLPNIHSHCKEAVYRCLRACLWRVSCVGTTRDSCLATAMRRAGEREKGPDDREAQHQE